MASYGDMDEIIREFFRASIDRTLDDFDFEEAFEYMEQVIYQKLTEHGLTEYEDYMQNHEDLFGRADPDGLDPYVFESDWCYISADEIHDAILMYTYEKLRRCYGKMSEFVDLRSLYDQMQNVHRLSTGEKAILFDAVIHAQHVTGAIFEDVDIEALKEEIDKEYS